MKLELISFKICPFVQRSVITLNYKEVPFETTYIDLSNPPSWFGEISPLGKVPVLRIDDNEVLFESAIICEYLDEVTPGSLQPNDPLRRAQNRAWAEFASAAIMDLSAMIHAPDADAFNGGQQRLKGKLNTLEEAFDSEGPYFNGEQVSLLDFSIAPLFNRIDLLGLSGPLAMAEDCPKVDDWAESLLQLDAVRYSTVTDFPEVLSTYIEKKSPYAFKAFSL
ncbi:hypothetical protein BOW53_11620 [Solemya pervernicosa gill symbiont]|uniref:glutathione transferase n=2 Tax=Gammaproteobacteria incertae sedis TaxID=118884 RepID=A0A1T2L2X9_9GAMM|nr:glutathione S-transferase family protein [Candidatus Reidiella endopervernicosa]OOZ39455.1 hypothetical protein BOW53_11620 [Solemya pervernicosa gill symbiont]QKQ26693.1 glutathione S-transferase family protein [Candidatus Reidiella endopervernicosa]